MIKRLLIQAGVLSGLFVAMAPLLSIADENRYQASTITLSETLYLSGLTGTPVQLMPGSYSIVMDEQASLIIDSSPPGKRNVLKSEEIAHIEEFSIAEARLLQGEGDDRSLVLLLPGGKGLQSEGSSTGIQPRQIVPPSTALRVGDSRRVRVVARTLVNWTGITLVAGQRYRFEVQGAPPFERGLWIDSGVRTTADGFATCPIDALCAPFRPLRRIPDANWFVMSGGIGDPSPLAPDLRHRFAIGDRRTITAPATGHLGLFANDVSTMYWNNEGSITIAITRIE
jgi:hypothetical protein